MLGMDLPKLAKRLFGSTGKTRTLKVKQVLIFNEDGTTNYLIPKKIDDMEGVIQGVEMRWIVIDVKTWYEHGEQPAEQAGGVQPV